jgi:NAD(P)H-hydrate epimerase
VLLGLVTGLLAQGLDAGSAAALAAFVHGAAGDALAARMGSAGLLAGELAAAVPATVAALAQARPVAQAGLVAAFPEP